MSRMVLTPSERTEQRAAALRALCIDYLNVGHLSPAWSLLVHKIHNTSGRVLDAMSDEDETQCAPPRPRA